MVRGLLNKNIRAPHSSASTVEHLNGATEMRPYRDRRHSAVDSV